MSLIFRGKLNAGDDLGHRRPGIVYQSFCPRSGILALLAGGIPCPIPPEHVRIAFGLLQTVNGVMVGEGKSRQPFFTGIVHQLRGREASVGTVGMNM